MVKNLIKKFLCQEFISVTMTKRSDPSISPPSMIAIHGQPYAQKDQREQAKSTYDGMSQAKCPVGVI
jgi:hypothetical protein